MDYRIVCFKKASRCTSYNGHTGGGGRGGATPERGTFFRAKGVEKDRDFITCMKG